LIAVTGATGFLGAHVVCHLLQAGRDVRALKRAQSSLAEFEYIAALFFKTQTPEQKKQLMLRLQWLDADIMDVPALTKAFDGVDTVYHCAAMVSFLKKDRNAMMQINIEGTTNVVNTALICGVKQLCHVSSIAALGRAKAGALIDEQSKWVNSNENSNYAVSKYKAEMEVWRGMEEGLQVVVVNPGVILGAGSWHKGSCKLFDLVWNGMPFYTTGVNGYVDVHDVAKAMLVLIEQKQFGERYVLVSDNLCMKDFLDTTATLLQKRKPKICVTPFIAKLAVAVDYLKYLATGKKPAITRETARTSLKTYYYSGKKIEAKTSFKFTPINETLAYICQELKQYKEHKQ
jgi:nucleoside-diphosphate-sugar epimerase